MCRSDERKYQNKCCGNNLDAGPYLFTCCFMFTFQFSIPECINVSICRRSSKLDSDTQPHFIFISGEKFSRHYCKLYYFRMQGLVLFLCSDNMRRNPSIHVVAVSVCVGIMCICAYSIYVSGCIIVLWPVMAVCGCICSCISAYGNVADWIFVCVSRLVQAARHYSLWLG